MALYNEMRTLRDRLLNLRETFGDPRLHDLAFANLSGSGFTFIIPRVQLKKPDPRFLAYTFSEEMLIKNNFYSCDISKTYSQELIQGVDNLGTCWLDAVVAEDGSITGTKSQAIVTKSASALKWNILLRSDFFNRAGDFQEGLSTF